MSTLRFRRSVVLIFATYMLISCDSDNDKKLSLYINEVKSRDVKIIEPMPELWQLSKFSYPETNQNSNPFIRHSSLLQPEHSKLGKLPLKLINYIGLIKDNEKIWGLLGQPGGEIIRVKAGDYIGNNHSKIMLILPEAMHLEESVKIENKWQKKTIIFAMHVDQKGVNIV